MSKRFLVTLLAILLVLAMATPTLAKNDVDWSVVEEGCESYPYWDTSLSYEERAADLISRMTVQEKLNQFHSHPQVRGTSNRDAWDNGIPRLGVATYMYPGEALVGLANINLWYADNDYAGSATLFPCSLGQASTWNPDLVAELANVAATEARSYYEYSRKGLTHWAPTINLGRDPFWGRSDESYSDDTFLTSAIGGAFVDGFQGVLDDSSDYLKAVATVKHFAANNSENTRQYGISRMTEEEYHEYYLRSFRKIAKENNPGAFMQAMNAIQLDGGEVLANYANPYQNIDVLRLTWGFDGILTSDNPSIALLYNNYFKGKQTELFSDLSEYWQAAALSINTGMSLELNQTTYIGQHGMTAVQNGMLTEKTLDSRIMDLYVTRMRTGEFDKGFGSDETVAYTDITQKPDELYTSAEHKEAALEVAEQAIVLLENNDNALPLSVDIESLVLVGIDNTTLRVGGYTSAHNIAATADMDISIQKGLQAICDAKGISFTSIQNGVKNTTSNQGTAPNFNNMTEAQQTAIMEADVVVVYIFTNTADGSEGRDRTTLDIPAGQGEFATDIAARRGDKKTITYMQTINQMNVAPLMDSNDKLIGGDALLWSCYNGQAQGAALANTLFGESNPSGRLTVLWYKDAAQLGGRGTTNKYSDQQGNYHIAPTDAELGDDIVAYYGKTYQYFRGDIRYNFGYGLSYSNFTYSNFTMNGSSFSGDDDIIATVTVKNDSDVAGYEVVQLYVETPNATALDHPDRQLVGFKKIWLDAGASQTVSIPITQDDLAFWDAESGSFACDLGVYNVYFGTDCLNKIPNCVGEFNLASDVTPTVFKVTVTPDSLINNPGDCVATTVAVSMNNDKLYKRAVNLDGVVDGDLPAGMTISFSSSDEKVTTVSDSGVISAVGNGVCKVIATVSYNGKTFIGYTAQVTVSPDPIVESVSAVRTLVYGCAANVPVSVAASDLSGLKVYLFGQTQDVVNGTAKFYFSASQVPAAGTYSADVLFNGKVVGSTAINVVNMPDNIWEPVVTVADGQTKVIFAADISFNEAKKSVKIDGVAIRNNLVAISGKELTIAADASEKTVVIAGLKYPELFPSYSFTFTLQAT